MGRQTQASTTDRSARAPRPRWARITAAGGSALVTVVALLGGSGLIPGESAVAGPVGHDPTGPRATAISARLGSDVRATPPRPTATPRSGRPTADLAPGRVPPRSMTLATKPRLAPGAGSGAPPVPAGSGAGRRVVFDMSAQRVWLVAPSKGTDVVLRTYLVSGSVTDNLGPGRYAVYSTSVNAWGVDDSGSMRYMVRFTRGANAAIGFHDIPVLDGRRVQTRAQLGTPRSHGCIRQWRADAKALWDFAPVGTTVVVTA